MTESERQDTERAMPRIEEPQSQGLQAGAGTSAEDEDDVAGHSLRAVEDDGDAEDGDDVSGHSTRF